MSTEVRDSRRVPFYWVENKAFDVLAWASGDCARSEDPHRRRIGPLLHAVYHAIARHLNQKSGTTWIKIRSLSELLGAGRSKVFEALHILEEYHLLRRISGSQNGRCSRYELLDGAAAAAALSGQDQAESEGPGDPSTARTGVFTARMGAVRDVDAPPKPLREKEVSSKSAEVPVAPEVPKRVSRPSAGRKSKTSAPVQDGALRDGKINKGGPGPLPLRSILQNIGDEAHRQGEALVRQIVGWLCQPAFRTSTSRGKLTGITRNIVAKVGLEKLGRIFTHVSNGSDPHPQNFWKLVNNAVQ